MLDDNSSILALPEIVLASGSPRRSEILTSVGWRFTKDSADIDEAELPGESPEVYVQRLALEKAIAVSERHPGAVVLGADTTVVLGERIIGKPRDLDEAREMLASLSGKWHDVLTGVAMVRRAEGEVVASVGGMQRTRVKFAEMSSEEVEFLALEGSPLDKAGAYAVQAQAALFIEGIEGDYWNVVGLPINLVYSLFEELAGKAEL
jgi:septum formation protein